MTLTRQNLDDLPRGSIVRATDRRGLPVAAVKIGDHQTTGGHTWSLTGPALVESFQLAQRDAVLLTEAVDTATKAEAEALASVPVHARGGGDPSSGVGWYEVIHPSTATTLLAHVHEDGSVYFPETSDGRAEFEFAAARGNVHRLVRAAAVSRGGDESVELACAWSDFRKDYGARGHADEYRAFVAGWQAGGGTLDAGGPLR